MELKNDVYPDLSKINGQEFRLHVIEEVLKEMKNDLNDYEALLSKFRKKSEARRNISMILGSLGTAFGIAGGSLGATGVGVIPGSTLISLGALLGVGSIIRVKLEKNSVKTLEKYDKLVSLSRAKLFSVEKGIEKALNDKKISDEEFNRIYGGKSKYNSLQRDILNSKLKPLKASKESVSESTKDLGDKLVAVLKGIKKKANKCKCKREFFPRVTRFCSFGSSCL